MIPQHLNLPLPQFPSPSQKGNPHLEPTPTQAPDAPLPVTDNPPILYYTQAGDTLPVVAVRFGVDPAEITSPDPIPETSLISPNQLLIIPDRFVNTTPAEKILPDSEIVFGPSAMDFDIKAFINEAGGYLSTYQDYLGSTGWTSGADIVWRVGLENSINPRLLLALLEYQSGWVYGQPIDLLHTDYPMGKVDINRKQLYLQLAWAVNEISTGYYGWREGLLTDIQFPDGVSTPRLAPELNAGSVALQYYLSKVYDTTGWIQSLDPKNGLPGLYERMFGSPWARAQEVEPLIPAGMTQPRMILPFFIGQMWSYTGGPHGAWEKEGARAALDFAPASSVQGCSETWDWALAMAPGQVVRSGNGVVVIDLDGDGSRTDWLGSVIFAHRQQRPHRAGYMGGYGGYDRPSFLRGRACNRPAHPHCPKIQWRMDPRGWPAALRAEWVDGSCRFSPLFGYHHPQRRDSHCQCLRLVRIAHHPRSR